MIQPDAAERRPLRNITELCEFDMGDIEKQTQRMVVMAEDLSEVIQNIASQLGVDITTVPPNVTVEYGDLLGIDIEPNIRTRPPGSLPMFGLWQIAMRQIYSALYFGLGVGIDIERHVLTERPRSDQG